MAPLLLLLAAGAEEVLEVLFAFCFEDAGGKLGAVVEVGVG